MKRILCIVGGMNAGGAETFLMKIYRQLDKNLYQMDFCVSKPEKGFYDDEIILLGGVIHHIKSKSKNPFAYASALSKLIKKNNYNYIMRISQHSLAAFDLLIAKFAGAKVRVFRSSNSHTMKNGTEMLLHNIFKFLPRLSANVKIAPSLPAAEFMFGKRAVKKGKVLFLNNGIPISKFSFDMSKREKIRTELGIAADSYVVGHIGRFTEQKNHKKLLEIFSQIKCFQNKAKLVLVGEGELESQIKEYAEMLGIKDSVLFVGIRKDIPDILSAMDVFVFPSLYEGMPNTVIEAQANGLPCVISDTITPDVKMCKNIFSLSLSQDADVWAKEVLGKSKRVSSEENAEILRANGYDIELVVSKFTEVVFMEQK